MGIRRTSYDYLTNKVAKKLFKHKNVEQHALKNENYHLNMNIYSYLETSGGQSSNLYLNVVHLFNTGVNGRESAIKRALDRTYPG